jgi:glycosyltransferase involved in cell wall biosynthesis
MKKILIITYYWPPSGGGGVQRWMKLTKYLSDFNIEPIVLTVEPEYASYPHIDEQLSKEVRGIKTYRSKSFEILKFYGQLFGKKNIPHSAFANVNKKSLLQTISRFVRGNFFIPDPRKGWNSYAIKEAKKIILEHHIDTIITSSPPHSTQLIGLQLKKEMKINWIADLRDPWTDIFYYKDLLHVPSQAKKDRNFELEVLRKSDRIITVSDSIKTLFYQKLGGQKDKIHVIPNGYDPADFMSNDPVKNTAFTFGYIGSLTEEYSPSILFEALNKLRSTFDFRLKFVGNVSPEVKRIIEENNLSELCTYIDRVQHDIAVKEMQQSDALLLFIPNVRNNEGILTGKIFEYIACRKPIIGIGPENGDAAKILAAFSSCQLFDYSSTEVLPFIQNILENAATTVSDINSENSLIYSRKYQAGQIADIIKAL